MVRSAVNAVLIIDGDDARRREKEKFFVSQGVKTLGVATGEAGLDAAARHKPHAVIVDTSIADEDAHLVRAKLKRLAPGSCVVLVAAEDDPRERKFAKFVLADAVFSRDTAVKQIYGYINHIFDNQFGKSE